MKQLIIIFILFIFFLIACKKEKLDDISETYMFDINSNCTDTNIPELKGFNTGYRFYNDSNNVNYAYFNPNNPNEFLYFNQYISNNIYIYSRTSNTKKILTNAHLLSPPKWGKHGWILLDNGVIYIIKENGDSLQQMFTGYNPEWNSDGNKFAYAVINWDIGKYIGVTYNTQTNTKDTLPFMLNAGKCWQNNSNKIIFYSSEEATQGFVLVDMNTKTRTLLNKIESSGPPCWINENEFVYTSNQKIYIFNILTGNSKAIAKFCSNEFGSYMSYSPISKELITSITHWKSLGENKILITSKIIILNFKNNSVTYISP
jgi:hypothetical protein